MKTLGLYRQDEADLRVILEASSHPSAWRFLEQLRSATSFYTGPEPERLSELPLLPPTPPKP